MDLTVIYGSYSFFLIFLKLWSLSEICFLLSASPIRRTVMTTTVITVSVISMENTVGALPLLS